MTTIAIAVWCIDVSDSIEVSGWIDVWGQNGIAVN
jgi:hypothetical protein